jgi:hypothetical protein
MVYEWHCENCDFVTVSSDQKEMLAKIRAHLKNEGGSVLMYQSPQPENGHETCTSYLSASEPTATGVLILTRSPADKLAAWHRTVGEWPAELRLLTPQSNPDLTDRAFVSEDDFATGPLMLTEIEGTSLQHLAHDVDTALQEMADSHAHVTVGIDTLSDLIATYGTKPMFKFTHAFQARLRDNGAFAHWHYAPATQPSATDHIVEQLFQLAHDTRDGNQTLKRL